VHAGLLQAKLKAGAAFLHAVAASNKKQKQ
jgi:hypothetical protein